MRSSSYAKLIALAVAANVNTVSTFAQSVEQEANKAKSVRDRALIAQLMSNDKSEVKAGYQAMHKLGADAKAVVPTANRVLSRGLPTELAMVAMRALAQVGLESSSDPIGRYLRHRSVILRREAARALVKTRGERAKTALVRGLSDRDPDVRTLSATGLGELGATEHVGSLITALDHRVMPAAGAIGQLCNPQECEQFASRLGRIQLGVMAWGFEHILFRDPKQMPDDQKLRTIERIKQLGTDDARNFLNRVLGRWPKEWHGPVRDALEEAVNVPKRKSRGGA